MNAIQLSDLTKYYGKSRGILDLNLEIKEGEFFGFIGPNGAGKSTTIRTMLGLISPSSGQAKLFETIVGQNTSELLSRIGYLPSEAVFYRGMKVKDLLKLSADLQKKDCSAERKRLCSRLQLDVNRKVDELSFGNRKKVAIVSALQHKPELLMQREFFNIIRERNEQGATVFLSSHILSEIQRNCTRAAIIRQGKIIACDRVEALSRTNTKRITVQGKVSLVSLQGIRDLKENDGVTSFLYSGEIHQLLKTLSDGAVTDLSISDPNLDEIFLHYYENGGTPA